MQLEDDPINHQKQDKVHHIDVLGHEQKFSEPCSGRKFYQRHTYGDYPVSSAKSKKDWLATTIARICL
jgi:hypothetical protein